MAANDPASGDPSLLGSTDPAADGTPRAVWFLIGSIATAKLLTLSVVVWASRSPETGALIGATMLPWLAVAVALVAGPLLFRLRLRRVRARRAQLRRAEWMLPAERPVTRGAPPRPSRPRARGSPSAHPR